MQLFLTSVLPFLAHDHPSAVAFLTCRYHNFHSSIIPELLSNEERVESFYRARQKHSLRLDEAKQYSKLYKLFIQTPLMQFSPSLLLYQKNRVEPILKALLATKYFKRSLQKCVVSSDVPVTNKLLLSLSTIQSLTDLTSPIKNRKQLEIIINFPSLESLTISRERVPFCDPDPLEPAMKKMSKPSPPATKSLRNLTLNQVDAFQFIPYFGNVRKLSLSAEKGLQELDLHPLSSSLPLLTNLFLEHFTLDSIESLKNLRHLSTLHFSSCNNLELSFLEQESSLTELTTLYIEYCKGLSTPSSFESLVHAPHLHVLKLELFNSDFDNDCLQYLENMIHLRKLDLSGSEIVGDGRSLKTLMQNLFQLEELNLCGCVVGNQGAISGALYSTHSRLRVLNLHICRLVDDDLNGIGTLKNTLEDLDLSSNNELTNEALVQVKDLLKLKILKLEHCIGIDDLSPLKHCLNLEELDVSHCDDFSIHKGLTDDSFKVFSEEPNSFPNLRVLDLSYSDKLTEKVFEHLANNNHLVYQLKELSLRRNLRTILLSSTSARNNLCQLKGLQRLSEGIVAVTFNGIVSNFWRCARKEEIELMTELMRRLTNLEAISST